MKQLKTLFKNVPYFTWLGPQNPLIDTIQFDPIQVRKKDVFCAVIAYGIDGHQFIQEAIEKGACVIVCQELPKEIDQKVTFVQVADTLETLSLIASNYYGNPTQKMIMIGVTGTNGKTSTASLLHQLFRKLGHKAGLLSTVVNKINDLEIPTKKTTPHATELHRLCRKMVDENCQYCFMEVSSYGIYQKRVVGVHFAGAVFTNITHDHLDYHGSFEAYFKVKKGFLDSLQKPSFVVCNIDDKNCPTMVKHVSAELKTISVKNKDADFYCRVQSNQLSGLTIELEDKNIQLQLRGAFNAYNILSAYAVAVLLGAKKSKILNLLPKLHPIEGRFDFVQSKNDILGVVDYAHSSDALNNLYLTLNQLKTKRLITVVGCGGDRDKEKRPEMARMANKNSEVLILTSDNPRSENPLKIIEDMLSGLGPNPTNTVLIIPDRKQAIKHACSIAKSQDIVLVAGKGHEKYQEIKGVKYSFDDKRILADLLQA